MRHTISSLSLIACFLATPAWAADWMQFRGPNGSAVSGEKNLPVEFGPDKGLRWKVDLPGRGLSSPVIAEGRVFLTACSGYKQRRLHVLCLDAKTGKKLWERQFAATGGTQCHPKTNMAAPTPVTDGKRVFALFATGDLAALDRDGDLLWYRSLVGDYPDITNQVGMAASPVLAGNTLLLPMENAGDSFAAGLDVKTGKNRWKAAQVRGINWVTPLVLTRGGQTEALFQTARDLTAHEPETGKVLWKKEIDSHAIPSPVYGGGLIFVIGQPTLALRPGKSGAAPETEWKSNRVVSSYTSPVYHQGRLYTIKDRVGLNCLDARDGKEVWVQRITGAFSATPVIADGKCYVVTETGVVTVLELGDKPKVLATNDFKDTILATPAIADGAIYLRSDKHLYCIAKK